MSIIDAEFFIDHSVIDRVANSICAYSYFAQTHMIDLNGGIHLKETDDVSGFIDAHVSNIGIHDMNDRSNTAITTLLQGMETNYKLRHKESESDSSIDITPSFKLVNAAGHFLKSVLAGIIKAENFFNSSNTVELAMNSIDNDYFNVVVESFKEVSLDHNNGKCTNVASKVFECVANHLCNHIYINVESGDLVNTAIIILMTYMPEYKYIQVAPRIIKDAKIEKFVMSCDIIHNAQLFKLMHLLDGYITPVEWVTAVGKLYVFED